MAIGNLQGRARTRASSPRAKAECQCCGFWWSLSDLRKQFQWAGAKLNDTGFLVCRRCLDEPQQQFRSIILPPDPRPVLNARPSADAIAAMGGAINTQLLSSLSLISSPALRLSGGGGTRPAGPNPDLVSNSSTSVADPSVTVSGS